MFYLYISNYINNFVRFFKYLHSMFFTSNITLIIYVFTIIYYVVLASIMLVQQGNPISTHGELKNKLRMTHSVGIFMTIWALDYLLYLIPMLYSNDVTSMGYQVCFIVTMMMVMPALFMVMHAIVQTKVNTLRWTYGVASPFMLLLIWYLIVPTAEPNMLPLYITAAISMLFVIYLLVKYAKEYHIYVQRLKSEYSEISDHEIFWSWSCFAGFALQTIIFLLYEYYWEPTMEFAYWAISIVTAGYLCYCTCKQKPLDNEVVEEIADKETESDVIAIDKEKDKAFYAIIEKKLETLCEDKLLFLEPDLTRETLCRRLSISSTYLKMYFHSQDMSFYQYINTLRVEYAYRLMEEKPEMSIREASELSGFRSQTTFRKVFKDVIGCLPSEIRGKKEEVKNVQTNNTSNQP